ncbi:LuxR family transcriptional regulator [Caballeronia hypogeia]|uniref:LuxR family transcriptional regulator n=1 Tax=Caballeronia hypogeia TaxID=1777140 RepID=A0A158CQL5_9BURK|nr:LuxR family transcriptional regulator [Caballeronia hypogeia]SAK84653.1 LuxR family transcriptional regulator [Caballeronia hypogeia]
MHQEDAIHRAIRGIYEAALAPETWPSAIDAVVKAGGAHKALLLASGRLGFTLTSGFDVEDDVVRIRRELHDRPPRWVEAIPVGTSMLQTSAVSDADFKKCELYNEAVRPAGGFYGLVSSVLCNADFKAMLILARNVGAADFTADNVRTADIIGPHIATAIKVWQRIANSEGKASGSLEALSKLSIGVIFLDEAMCPVLANPCAEALAGAQDGLILNARQVSAQRSDDADALANAIASATRFGIFRRSMPDFTVESMSAWTSLIRRKPPRCPLVVRVFPLAVADSHRIDVPSARTLVFVMEPDRPSGIDESSVRAVFGLTRREAALAIVLARGADLRQDATEMNIGIGTVRSYVKRILAKTDTHRQAELVSVLLRASLHSVDGLTSTSNQIEATVGLRHRF